MVKDRAGEAGLPWSGVVRQTYHVTDDCYIVLGILRHITAQHTRTKPKLVALSAHYNIYIQLQFYTCSLHYYLVLAEGKWHSLHNQLLS